MKTIGKTVKTQEKTPDKIKEYHNKLDIVTNGFDCEYYQCGSHQMRLVIDIDKDKLIDFLKQLDIKEILKITE